MNCHAEIMEKFGVEVNVKIRYLDENNRKNYIFKLDFYILSKIHKHMKPYLESSFHVDSRDSITIEFSCRNDGKNGVKVNVQIQY